MTCLIEHLQLQRKCIRDKHAADWKKRLKSDPLFWFKASKWYFDKPPQLATDIVTLDFRPQYLGKNKKPAKTIDRGVAWIWLALLSKSHKLYASPRAWIAAAPLCYLGCQAVQPTDRKPWIFLFSASSCWDTSHSHKDRIYGSAKLDLDDAEYGNIWKRKDYVQNFPRVANQVVHNTFTRYCYYLDRWQMIVCRSRSAVSQTLLAIPGGVAME